MEYFRFSDGRSIPAAGFGVFRIDEGRPTIDAVVNAIQAGYRHIDTAQGYWNEEDVGTGIRESGIAREELYLVTKMWMYYYKDEQTAYDSICRSAEKLQSGYIDLMMLHQAVGNYYAAWNALQRAQADGIVKSIGVSNFTAERLTDLCIHMDVRPVINQIHIGPFEQKSELEAVHRKFGVLPESWSPLGGGDGKIFADPVLQGIAQAHGKSIPQIVLRWLYQKNIVSVAKSTHIERMRENISIFDFALTEAELAQIAALNTKPADEQDLRRAETAEILNFVVQKHADKY